MSPGQTKPSIYFNITSVFISNYNITNLDGLTYYNGTLYLIGSGALHQPSQIVMLNLNSTNSSVQFDHVIYLDGTSRNIFKNDQSLFWLELNNLGVLYIWNFQTHKLINAPIQFSDQFMNWTTAYGFSEGINPNLILASESQAFGISLFIGK